MHEESVKRLQYDQCSAVTPCRVVRRTNAVYWSALVHPIRHSEARLSSLVKCDAQLHALNVSINRGVTGLPTEPFSIRDTLDT